MRPAVDVVSGFVPIVQVGHGLLNPSFDHRHASVPRLRAENGLVLALDQTETGDEHDANTTSDGERDDQSIAADGPGLREKPFSGGEKVHSSYLLRMTIRAA